MSSLSTTAIIVIAAASGGVAVLGLLALVFVLLRRRGQGRFFNGLGRTQLGQHDGELDLREIETYTPSTSHGRLPHWRRLRTRAYGQDTALMLEESSIATGEDGDRQMSVHETSQGYRIVPNGGDGDQIDLEPVEGDELVDIYLPTGRPERAPLTPISERDTPDSSGRAFPRQGYHLPPNSRNWHHFTRPGRNLSPGWFSDSSSASSKKLSKQRKVRAKGKAKSTTDLTQPGVLRSLSFRSARNDQKVSGELTPTPDAIYDACSRLSPSPSRRLGRLEDRHGSDSDAAQTQSTKSSIFDGHGSYTTVGSNFPSSRTASKRDNKRNLHPDVYKTETSKMQEFEQFARARAFLGSPNTDPGVISVSQPPTLSGTPKTDPGSTSVPWSRALLSSPNTDQGSASVSPLSTLLTYPNTHLGRSPIGKGILSSLEQQPEQSRKDSPSSTYISKRSSKNSDHSGARLTNRSPNMQHVRHTADQKSGHPLKFWHEHTPKTKRAPLSKRAKARVLRESTGNSNRRSLSISPVSSSVANKAKSKKSRGSGSPNGTRPNMPRSQRKQRETIQRMSSRDVESQKVSMQTVLQGKLPDDSNPRRSVLLPEVELKPLTSNSKKRAAMKHGAIENNSDDIFGEDAVGPSALWSIIGDQSDASEPVKPEAYQSPSGFSFEDSEDVLHVSLRDHARFCNTASDIPAASHQHYSHEAHYLPRRSNEFYDVKPPLPLRPRSSMLKADALPASSQVYRSPSDIQIDRSMAVSELPHSLRIGSGSRAERTIPRRTSQRSIEKRRSEGSPSLRRSRDQSDQSDQSRPQPVAISRNPQKASRFSNSIAPPTHPPPPPPLMSARSQARMTSMMMELRRQNSDSSRYDSSYFRLPQSQRASQHSQYASRNDLGMRQSSSRSSRSYVVGSETVEQGQAVRNIPITSLGAHNQYGPTLWDRRARRERDPFTESSSRKHHQNFSRPQLFVITSPNYLPGYEPENLSTDKNALEHLERLEQQELIGQAIELGMSPEPILLLEPGPEPGRDSSSADPHRTPTDESEQDLSPMGKTIMAETRREQYGRQQRNGSLTSTRTSTEWQRSLHSPPPLSPPHSQYFQRPLPRPGTSQSTAQFHLVRPTHDHRRNKSSLSSVGRSNSSGLDELSQTELNAYGSSSLVEGRRSRRESQRQRVETLKERVASMEFAMKGKNKPEPVITYT